MKHPGTILIADDDPDFCLTTRTLVEVEGFSTCVAATGPETLALCRDRAVDVVLLDWVLGSSSSLGVLKEIAKTYPDLPVIVVTGHGSMESAADALREAAFDYLGKPFAAAELMTAVRRALDWRAQLRDRDADPPLPAPAVTSIVGKSPGMISVYRMIARAAPTDSTVLVIGESGTGKELVARAVHDNSPRAGKPFRRGQLRRVHREPAGIRAVRLRAGRVHRRPHRPPRRFRRRGRRHRLPRRGFGNVRGLPGETPARPAGTRDPARGGGEPAPGRRPDRRGHQSAHAGAARLRHLPARPAVPVERHQHRTPPPAGAQGRHPAPAGPFLAKSQHEARPQRGRAGGRGRVAQFAGLARQRQGIGERGRTRRDPQRRKPPGALPISSSMPPPHRKEPRCHKIYRVPPASDPPEQPGCAGSLRRWTTSSASTSSPRSGSRGATRCARRSCSGIGRYSLYRKAKRLGIDLESAPKLNEKPPDR